MSERLSPLLVPYIATVVLLTSGCVILIAQQAKVVRIGHDTARYRSEICREKAVIRRLELRVARLKSPDKLEALARKFDLELLPPDEALEEDLTEGEQEL